MNEIFIYKPLRKCGGLLYLDECN